MLGAFTGYDSWAVSTVTWISTNIAYARNFNHNIHTYNSLIHTQGFVCIYYMFVCGGIYYIQLGMNCLKR
jgi:uncharacterized MAPEG superfamily protein